MTIQIAVRLPDDLVEQLDQAAAASGGTRSATIRRAIELYLYRLACERDAASYERRPLTDSELALSDDPAAWSETPRW